MRTQPIKGLRRMRRPEASAYLKEVWGLTYGVRTLAKIASIGGGPTMEYAGRFPLYTEKALDNWARAKFAPGTYRGSKERVRRVWPPAEPRRRGFRIRAV